MEKRLHSLMTKKCLNGYDAITAKLLSEYTHNLLLLELGCWLFVSFRMKPAIICVVLCTWYALDGNAREICVAVGAVVILIQYIMVWSLVQSTLRGQSHTYSLTYFSARSHAWFSKSVYIITH